MSKKYKKLRQQILTLRDLHRKWSAIDIANELMNSDCPPSQTRFNLLRYIDYTLERGTVQARRRSGRPRTTRTPEFISLVQNNMENKFGTSIRKTNDLLKSEELNSSYGSVQRALKDDIELKPWKLARSQKISDVQRHERIESAKKLLKRFGTTPSRTNSKWKRLINTDFSGRINLVQKHNNKNSIIWSKTKTTIPLNLQTVGQVKFSPGILVYGGISSRGLIPNNSPIFIDEWLASECRKIGKRKITMDRFLYIQLIEEELKPHIDELYDDVATIWQDDGDSKHRSQFALEQISELFSDRVEPEEQADKMADIWPIENIWGHIKEKLRGEDIESITMLKRRVGDIWRAITPQMCSKLINSIPRRLQCLIDKDGYQVNKKDYNTA